MFWHFVTWLKVALVRARGRSSVGVFAYGVARPIAKYRRGRGGRLPPARELGPARSWRPAPALRAPRRSRGATAPPAWAHRAIFFGFITLFAGTVILGFDTDFTDPVFGWNYFHGTFYLAYKEVLNVLGTALIVGLLVMMARRAIVRPRKLDYARPDRAPGEPQFDRRVYRVGDWAFVGILLVIALTGFLLEGVRIAMDHPGDGGTQFGGWIAAQIYIGVGFTTARWPRSATACGGSTGCSRSRSSRASPTPRPRTCSRASSSLVAARPARRQAPARRSRPSAPTSPPATARSPTSAPRHLLELDACTKCGRCHEACPAFATGRPLSPRDVILELREQANQAAAHDRHRRRPRIAPARAAAAGAPTARSRSP